MSPATSPEPEADAEPEPEPEADADAEAESTEDSAEPVTEEKSKQGSDGPAHTPKTDVEISETGSLFDL